MKIIWGMMHSYNIKSWNLWFFWLPFLYNYLNKAIGNNFVTLLDLFPWIIIIHFSVIEM